MNSPDLRERIEEWARRLRVRPKGIRIQKMTRKWASCSPAGLVTFSSSLLGENRDFQDYVMAHELLHLRYRNHGKLFQATLKAHLATNRFLANRDFESPH